MAVTSESGYCYREVVPFVAMVASECLTVGLTTIYKAAVSKGLSYHIFMVYSYAISALVLLPLAFASHRKQAQLPPLTIAFIGKFFILGLLGFVSQYLAYSGIEYSNPMLAAALCNLTPATTFILTILFRMETLVWRSMSGQAKVIGTLVTITGALVAVLYTGPTLINTNHDKLLTFATTTISWTTTKSAQSNWIVGGALLAASYIVLSIWDTTQAKFVTEYPAEAVVVFFYNISSFIISLLVGIITESNVSAWMVPANVQLYSILYSGIIGSALSSMVRTWGLHVKGPVYVGLFKPLSIAIAAILGVLFLGENLYLGSVIGSVIISLGFYTVIWGEIKKRRIRMMMMYQKIITLNLYLLTQMLLS